ncbi:hypothetical protein Van01_31760 [Micromonospora andamanensis]|uniref:Uncharacterized protein n=1 Tax=Micromonospora andamanensis TaxID=1287068 RepID=A0ABQ4HWD2_9ACTN|nr:hypothetical protein Van01_31760 [Micromonospora andamanensis]
MDLPAGRHHQAALSGDHPAQPGRDPYLIPELVLLFKAKHVRPKDQSDFDGTLPLLTGVQRETLTRLLRQVHPGHAWLTALRMDDSR